MASELERNHHADNIVRVLSQNVCHENQAGFSQNSSDANARKCDEGVRLELSGKLLVMCSEIHERVKQKSDHQCEKTSDGNGQPIGRQAFFWRAGV